MATIKDFAISLLMMALPVSAAAAILLFRDRRTLRPDMSPGERSRAINRNTARTLNWWHLIVLIGIFAVLVLGPGGKGRNRSSIPVVEAAVAAFLVFRYYRQHAEESIKPDHRSGRQTFIASNDEYSSNQLLY
ncbi:MAG TPA: hypothetical protein VKH81_06770 [Candidatus Angelobacter sp.]|nr:hypothetical protein [Candidatus Angelobacter sp.]